ncbi:MAG: holo-ACP synthase [Lachnospiraceae bacterium]|nr:holo-ACP synthase [Lachnospiraceae bacterium]
MILGIGNDIIKIERVKKASRSAAFMQRVYTALEQEQFQHIPASLAGNFAVKEAVAKMLGTGFRGFGPADIEVLRDEQGCPFVKLYNKALERSDELAIRRIWVTISHEKEFALATAIGEGGPDCGGERKAGGFTQTSVLP